MIKKGLISLNYPFEQVRVTLGEYVLKSDVEPLPGRTYGASVIKVHPYFKFTPQEK
jgi:transmembrane serine protease 6